VGRFWGEPILMAGTVRSLVLGGGYITSLINGSARRANSTSAGPEAVKVLLSELAIRVGPLLAPRLDKERRWCR
jgi:hypothetical protein